MLMNIGFSSKFNEFWVKCIPMFVSLISWAKSLIKIEKSVAEIESPCFTPTGQSKKSVSNSFNKIVHLGLEYIAEIAL